MANKELLIKKLKNISKEMRIASRLTKEIYCNENASELKGAAKIIDSWILSIKEDIDINKIEKEIKNGK